MHTIVAGRQFAMLDERGDASGGHHGVYSNDTRVLARWVLTLDSEQPQPLGAPHGSHGMRTFVQRNARPAGRSTDDLLVTRRMAVGRTALFERIELRNVSLGAARVRLGIEAASDFADMFTVKALAFGRTGDDTGHVGLPDGVRSLAMHLPEHDKACAATISSDTTTCWIESTEPFELDGSELVWSPRIESAATWTCDVRVTWALDAAGAVLDATSFDAFADGVLAREHVWREELPTLEGAGSDLAHTWRTSIDDLGALRIASGRTDDDADMLTAAGMPWFMTVFGRDSILTCMETMLLGPERAKGVLRYLAERQADADDPARDAEPGKIMHELREGSIAGGGYDVYYGSLDSTPLFLMLVAELYAWTGDDAFVRELWPHVLRAIEWLDVWGDRDDDGFLEYGQRAPHGLVNQSWKDSWDSERHVDGTLARTPIAPVEIQGYAYAARVGAARLARDVLGDEHLAAKLETQAGTLRAQFARAFWVDGVSDPNDIRASGYFAHALDGAKQPIATLSSNIGHLLWTGILDEEHAALVARQLEHETLFNGWGLRTIADSDAVYNPISYHNGSVWPHDTALAIAGLARCGFTDAATRIARGLLDAARAFDGRLPEVFAGLGRDEVEAPVDYPTASSPQSWAAAAPVLVLQALLGIEPEVRERRIVATSTSVPEWLDGVRIERIHAFGRDWTVHVTGGCAQIEATDAMPTDAVRA